MVMKTVLLALMLSVVACMARAAEPLGQVRLVSEQWIDYTNADGSGVAWDVLRKVFEPAGVKVLPETAPYSRAIGLVKRGEADAWVGSYKQEDPDSLYPRWHFDMDHIYALSLADKPLPVLADIGRSRLAWVRGYDFHRYLPGVDNYREIQRREGILPMLEHDRVDYYIDAQTEVDYVLEQASQPSRFRRSHLVELPLYLAFTDSARGTQLRDLFDRRMEQLVRSGELKPIFQRWKQPYPFKTDSQPQ
ncbi:transporter substrate-binding domain-containing protein [Pseudomonas sp. S75]|uniref:substrate-binding periplasmic protein n=1 Tax=unclassified Pseudomonas TaxID=196821 RepID=UPI0019030676|nr:MULTISPECIES: transporter substrate-binding domain-containing protein [unclassified Pseudomonas]MBJ9977445.1 transporter substrate-binding domain-containing protein [Pseudomonas sp. S30]MBK0154905.1 transporter substrate-binding domain-containing protein [Pseudomonas sp. S75]